MQPRLTKGQVLREVRGKLTVFRVPDFVLKGRAEWEADPDTTIDGIQQHFGARLLAIRSSASDEDGISQSQAGQYDSVLNVSSADREAIRLAISQVMGSYTRRGAEGDGQDVLIQEMVQDVILSGVVFTHELNTGAPYYVVNYDDVSGFTDTVTSGSGEYANRTLYIHRDSAAEVRSERFKKLISAVAELEGVAGSDTLDIEFALDSSLQPHLLQFRAITTHPNWNRGLVRQIDSELDGIQFFVRQRFRPVQGVFGTTTLFGQMPDWNPAEMLGRAPRALALSLYRRLITDSVWRQAREKMGYAVPTGQALMVSLAGQPYIDIRLSFHSFLPATLPPKISNKLVDTWVERLRQRPELHDKIEFDVAVTAFTFDMEQRLDVLCETLDTSERTTFVESLRRLTLPLVHGEGEGSIGAALERVEALSRRELLPLENSPLELSLLIEECIRYGTLPFAILARHGFIARSLLLSLVSCGVLDQNDVARLQGTTRTVASELIEQIDLLQRNEIKRADFMARFGHLRPGTYDILSPRYDAMEAFGQTHESMHRTQQAHCWEETFNISAQQHRQIDLLLKRAGFDGMDSPRLLAYIKSAIVSREYGKFIFTRSVSSALELIAAFGEEHGLSRKEMSHVDLDHILAMGVESGRGDSIEDQLREVSKSNSERHTLAAAIRLPQILFDEASIRVVPFQVSQPNFVTTKKVSADTVYLSPYRPAAEMNERIIIIDNADPGYDWIFAHKIAGLVTKYGGANSHMAIRCAEFGVPAAIGCGEQRFDALLKAGRLSLDCAVGTIDILY